MGTALDKLQQDVAQAVREHVQQQLHDRGELHRQALERQARAHRAIESELQVHLEQLRRDLERVTREQDNVRDRRLGEVVRELEAARGDRDQALDQLEDAQRELEQLRDAGNYTAGERNRLGAELQEVRGHLDHVLGQLRVERDEHAELLREYARADTALAELHDKHSRCAEGVLLEADDLGGSVLVRLDQPGRMVTISSVPYTEDEQVDGDSDLDVVSPQEYAGKHAAPPPCTCPPAVQGVERVNLGHRRSCPGSRLQ